jgi:hypothetical protein
LGDAVTALQNFEQCEAGYTQPGAALASNGGCGPRAFRHDRTSGPKRDDGDSEIASAQSYKKTHVLSFSHLVDLRSIETALQAAWHHNPCKDTSGLLARLKKRSSSD